MTEFEAMRNLAIAAGASVDEVRRAFGVLREFKVDAEPLMNYLKVLGKQMRSTHKSYVSPYAKFDKIRRKRK